MVFLKMKLEELFQARQVTPFGELTLRLFTLKSVSNYL